jgi:glutamyl-tRNA(Gln) amidotransferase subunit E
MRPRPGAARMYPETDIPPTQITEDYIGKISMNLPELPEQKLERLKKVYKLNEKLARQILDSEYGELFETIVSESGVSPTTVAAFMTETAKGLKRDGVCVEKVSDKQVREIFKAIGSGRLTKESIPEVIGWLSKHEDNTLQEAIDNMGLRMLSTAELEKTIEAIIGRNRSLIEEKGASALGPLLGMVMREVRGKANATLVGEFIKKRLEQKDKK